jgi:hypothetical protein
MKKITDERLIFKNLQNIKIAYIIQTLGILCILGYDFFQGGLEKMRSNPLWFLFILTSVVSAYLSMSVSIEYEKENINPKKSFMISLIVLTAIVVISASLISITPGYGWGEGLLVGGVIFICGLTPLYYVYRLRMK